MEFALGANKTLAKNAAQSTTLFVISASRVQFWSTIDVEPALKTVRNAPSQFATSATLDLLSQTIYVSPVLLLVASSVNLLHLMLVPHALMDTT